MKNQTLCRHAAPPPAQCAARFSMIKLEAGFKIVARVAVVWPHGARKVSFLIYIELLRNYLITENISPNIKKRSCHTAGPSGYSLCTASRRVRAQRTYEQCTYICATIFMELRAYDDTRSARDFDTFLVR